MSYITDLQLEHMKADFDKEARRISLSNSNGMLSSGVANGTTMHAPPGNIWANAELSNLPPKIQYADDAIIAIGDDFEVTGAELKTCLKLLRKMAMEEHPEEFI